jgi:hypothetical protein
MYLIGLAVLVACMPGSDFLTRHRTATPLALRLMNHGGYTQDIYLNGFKISPYSAALAVSVGLLLVGNILAALAREPLSPYDLRRPLSTGALRRLGAALRLVRSR